MLVHLSGSVEETQINVDSHLWSQIYRFNYLSVIWCLTLCRFGARADAIVGVIDLFSLHHDVLETFVVSVETVLQQLTESHRAADHKSEI